VAARRPELAAAVMVGAGHAPVVAVLLGSAKEKKRQTSPFLPPKGTDPPDPTDFPLQTSCFQGTAEGAMIAIVDPGQADAQMWARGHAPVGAVLVPALKKVDRQTIPFLPQRARTPRTPRLFPCKPAVFRGPPKGP
jgi:hypothetical protein